ncbi:MAG: hypothetical protein ACFFEY_10160 [Candidatus Thorarchaeota archaeon]
MITIKKSHKIVLFVVAACLVTAGTVFGVLIFTTWGVINYENSYYYTPGVASSIEKVTINCDIGSVLIKYNNTPTDKVAQIDLDIKIEGILVKGSAFSDFFYTPIWQNQSSPEITFTLDVKATTWFIFGLDRQVKINLTLRTDIVYDINTYVSTGIVTMNVPKNAILNNTIIDSSTGSILVRASDNVTFLANTLLSTSTGSIALYANQVNFSQGLSVFTSTGSLTLNFSKCIIGDHLIGDVSTGSILFNSYNMEYSDVNNWRLETSTGSIDVNILQYKNIGNNITGLILTSTGSIDGYYRDDSPNIGAKFTCSTSTGSNSYTPIGSGGFTQSGANPKVITSDDYDSANNKYTFSLITSTGSIGVAAESL